MRPLTRAQGQSVYWAGVPHGEPSCRVYWGSHGCHLQRGHKGHHECQCARDEYGNLEPKVDEEGVHNVGAWPYYGRMTRFYGEDVSLWQRFRWRWPNWLRRVL